MLPVAKFSQNGIFNLPGSQAAEKAFPGISNQSRTPNQTTTDRLTFGTSHWEDTTETDAYERAQQLFTSIKPILKEGIFSTNAKPQMEAPGFYDRSGPPIYPSFSFTLPQVTGVQLQRSPGIGRTADDAQELTDKFRFDIGPYRQEDFYLLERRADGTLKFLYGPHRGTGYRAELKGELAEQLFQQVEQLYYQMIRTGLQKLDTNLQCFMRSNEASDFRAFANTLPPDKLNFTPKSRFPWGLRWLERFL